MVIRQGRDPGRVAGSGASAERLENKPNPFQINNKHCLGMLAHAFNPRTRVPEAEAGRSLKFNASLDYRMSFWIVRTTQRNLDSKNKK